MEVFSNPEWIKEIRKSIKLLIAAGFAKKEIKFKYKQEPETQEQIDTSPDPGQRMFDLLSSTNHFEETDLDKDSDENYSQDDSEEYIHHQNQLGSFLHNQCIILAQDDQPPRKLTR